MATSCYLDGDSRSPLIEISDKMHVLMQDLAQELLRVIVLFQCCGIRNVISIFETDQLLLEIVG